MQRRVRAILVVLACCLGLTAGSRLLADEITPPVVEIPEMDFDEPPALVPKPDNDPGEHPIVIEKPQRVRLTPEQIATEERMAEDQREREMEREARKRAKSVKPAPYPGSFIGARAGFGLGEQRIPRLGIEEEVTRRVSLLHAAPYVGVEVGYVAKNWGGAMTAEVALSVLDSGFLDVSPLHFLAGFELIYVPDRRHLRWIFGFNPYSYLRMVYPSGELMELRGIGLRGGAHIRSANSEKTVFEPFFYVSIDRFVEVEAGFSGNTRNYIPSDFVGIDTGLFVGMLVIGIQVNFAY